MKFNPIRDQVLVRRVEKQEKTASGILIPEAAQRNESEGEVLEVGPGYRTSEGSLVPLEINKGMKVLFNRGAGSPVKVNGEDLVLMRESDILGFLSDTNDPYGDQPSDVSRDE